MGPLKGIKIIEFAGIGPGPFCGMALADLGADVITINRATEKGRHNKYDIHNRSKRTLTADLRPDLYSFSKVVNSGVKDITKSIESWNEQRLRLAH